MCSTPKSITLKAPTLLPVGMSMDSKIFHSTYQQSNENVERLQQQRLREFHAKEPEFQHQIEIDNVRCPSHLIQFNRALNIMNANQTLKISSHSAALINDLAASARILNIEAQTLRFRRQHLLYVTKAI